MKCQRHDFLKLSKDTLNKGYSLRFQAKGWSMFPAVKDGDILNVEPVEAKDIRPQDIIFYKTADESLITHRVIKKYFSSGRPVLVTKGDFNSGEDEKVPLEGILGRVKIIERKGRRLRIDRGPGKLRDGFYAKISSLLRIAKKIVSALLPRLQGLKAYRSLARRLIKPELIYQWEGSGDFKKCLLVRHNGLIVSSMHLYNLPETNRPYNGWWIFGMWVHWRYRRLGIGRRLTEMACNFAAKRGASEVKLWLFTDNKPATNLYWRMGFYQISIPEIGKQSREKAKKTRRQQVIMKKDL